MAIWVDGVTPLSAHNFNMIDNLKSDCIQGTTQTPTFVDGQITQIVHKDSGGNTVRTDTFAYTTMQITETRTLSTGETITLEYNFDSSGNYTGTVVS